MVASPRLLLVILLSLAAILYRYQERNPPLFSYDGDYFFDPTKTYKPSSLEDIQSFLKLASKESKKIKVLGVGHSRSPIALSENLYISLCNYKGVVKIDPQKKLATFRGGSTLWEILHVLSTYNLTLPILPAIGDQTIGGAIATGTHGSGIKYGNIASYIQSILLVTLSGEVIEISSNDDLFYAAGVSMGLLGIIAEVTLKCVTSYNLKETRTTYNLDYCLEHLMELATTADNVKLWIEINSKSCYAYVSNKTTELPKDSPSNTANSIKMIIWEVFQLLFSIFPSLTSTGMKFLFATDFFFSPYSRVDYSWNVQIGSHYMSPNKQAEIAVPMENCVEAVKDFFALVEKENIPINHIIEIRFVKGDDFWLSNNYRRDSCHITKMLYNPSDDIWNSFYKKFYRATLKYDGRPHWGKSFSISPKEMHQLYPKFNDFLIVRQKLDPKGLFLNNYISDTFGI